MNEQPAQVAQEAKGIHQSLKELLKTKEPCDKEVEFQRKNLRRRYLNLLLIHPYEKESKEVENHLWMQTSYAFISSFKQRIAALDRLIRSNSHQPQQGQQQNQRQNNHGPVEHRRLLTRFRQFLSEEDKFWTQLVQRLYRSFGIEEAKPALESLKMLSSAEEHISKSHAGAADIREPASNGRNHFQFPPENATISVIPTNEADRESRVAILSKALVCLGDIARYRELYSEGNGRPRAGHEEGPQWRRARNRRGGAGSEAFSRPRNYDKARQCYDRARSLVPHEGNPSHQLAILASYQRDLFASVIHYYRALCVRQPYDTAAENLNTVLNKTLEQWRARNRRDQSKNGAPDPSTLPPRVKIELFKERLVLQHALWRLGMDKGIEKMESVSRRIERSVFEDFFALVSQRHLQTEVISDVVVLSQGALWKHRMLRDAGGGSKAKNEAVQPSASVSTRIEWSILDLLFDVYRALLEVGIDELKVPPPTDAAENDLAQKITAIFRRTLPSLRIVSKWLRANFSYILQDQEFLALKEKENAKGVEICKERLNTFSGYSTHTIRFWKIYADFLRTLSRSFPIQKLPPLTMPLEEDILMRGFLPLKKLMDDVPSNSSTDQKSKVVESKPQEQVHPNVEQLMRIADLLEDGRILATMENSPVCLRGDYVVFNDMIIEDSRSQTHPGISPGRNFEDPEAPLHNQELLPLVRDTKPGVKLAHDDDDDDDDNMTSHTSKTEEELSDILKFLHYPNQEEIAIEDDDQDDQIVWDLKAPVSPVKSPPSRVTPISPPVNLVLSPQSVPLRSPLHTQNKTPFGTPSMAPMVASTTAQDLLNNVMGVGRVANSGKLHVESSAPQPRLLFGNELSQTSQMVHKPNQSIWSASRDELPLKYTGANPSNHIYQTQVPPIGSPPQDLSRSIWTSSYPNNIYNSQHSLSSPLSPSFLAQQPQSAVTGSHYRAASSTISSAQLLPNHNQLQQVPFEYTSSMVQQPIHRPGNLVGLGSVQMSPMKAPSNDSFYNSPGVPSYHSRHMSLHDPRFGQPFIPPAMSQSWHSPG